MSERSRASFDEVDAVLRLSRFGGLCYDYDTALTHHGDLTVSGDWNGADLLRHFGFDPASFLLERIAFVIDGSLVVGGTLDLDDGVFEDITLMVTGGLRAEVVRVGYTLLFVYQGAQVSRLISFCTNDGTLSIAGNTSCPLILCDDGDLNVDSSGHILCREQHGWPGGGPAGGEEGRWPTPTITLGPADVSTYFVDELCGEDDWIEDSAAVAFAREGRTLWRADRPA